jgi:hypothetical protein
MTDTTKLTVSLMSSLGRIQAASGTIASTTTALVKAITDGLATLNNGGQLIALNAIDPVESNGVDVEPTYLNDAAAQSLFAQGAHVVKSISLRCDETDGLGIVVRYEISHGGNKAKLLTGEQFQACGVLHQPDIIAAIITGLGAVATRLEERVARIAQVANSI